MISFHLALKRASLLRAVHAVFALAAGRDGVCIGAARLIQSSVPLAWAKVKIRSGKAECRPDFWGGIRSSRMRFSIWCFAALGVNFDGLKNGSSPVPPLASAKD
jgi:hypothetical protein